MEMIDGMILMWLISAAIGCLPEPKDGERWYSAGYKFLQLVGANLPRLIKRKP